MISFQINLIIAIISALVGAGLTYLFCLNKINKVEKIDEATKSLNCQIRFELANAQRDLQLAYEEKEKLDTSYKKSKNELDEVLQSIQECKINAEKIYNKVTNDTQDAMDRELERISLEFQKAREDCIDEYHKAIADYNADMVAKMAEKEQEYRNIIIKIEESRKISNAAVEANKRAAKMEEEKDFYKLNLSDKDKEEIKKLRAILPQLRNAEPLNKVIWKVYYENPYTDLIGRVVGSGIHCGIYKITNLENGMCYVGQAVNIADRWKQHIKRGIGAEAPTRNKLYPAMLSIGVENFSFEIIEECDRSKLNEREDYWQEFFKAKEFGYSIK